jgi:signal transduction histidine kinase
VTGATMQLALLDMVKVARIAVPDLRKIALVGDPLERQTFYRHFLDEIPAVSAQLEIINLTDLPLGELAQRLATLPDHTAVIYTGIYYTSEGVSYVPAELTSQITAWANRPVVINVSSYLNKGAVGGYIVQATPIGQQVGRMALRLLDGEAVSDIPIVKVPSQLIFEWPALQRWKISEKGLPPQSRIYFRDPSVWEQYRGQIIAVCALVLIQGAMISGLLYERRRRHLAELQSRQRMAELAHINRYAMAGELTASIAHEINQPLGSILTNAETAQLMLKMPAPDLNELGEILGDIQRDDQRASDVIVRLRSLLKKTPFELSDFDLNALVGETIELLSGLGAAREVRLNSFMTTLPLPVKADRVQLQQVIVNLVINAMDAMSAMPLQDRSMNISTAREDTFAELSIKDSGPGIPQDNLKQIFEPFFTTKPEGMGMGLSIARTIVEAHGGQLSVENRAGGGAVFRVRLKLEHPTE